MGVVDYGILNHGSIHGAPTQAASQFGPYSSGHFAPYSNGPPAGQWMEPYLNLVASQHNATVSKHSSDYSLLEIEPSGNALTESGEDLPVADTTSRAPMERGPDRLGRTGGESTTTMGAVTLLAFLNLLGYIQSVLTGVGRRRRRSPEEVILSTERAIWPLARHGLPSPAADEGRGIPIPPIPTFFEEVVRGLGFWQEDQEEQTRLMASRRVDGRDAPLRRAGHKEGWSGFFSSLGQRFRLAANLMGFLNNPGPTRVRRTLDDAVKRAVRSKRFTASMNAWYEDLAGTNYEGAGHGGGQLVNGLISKMMLGLGRGIFGL